MTENDISFVDMLREEKSKGVELKKMHFAMNGMWSDSRGHIHKLDDEVSIVNWFQGLIEHLKSQLEFLK